MKASTFWRIAAIAVAFGLRLIVLNTRPLWYDEAFALLYAARSFAEMIAGTATQVSGVAADVHPLFYYFSLHVWTQLAGESVFAARFWSVLYGVATIAVVYRVAHELFGARVGIVAAWVVALAPFHIAYSQEARMYTQLAFWSALALCAFAFYWRTTRKRWWLVLVVAGTLALYSHNLAFLNFVALGIWTTADAARTRSLRLFNATALAGVAMLILWLPGLFLVPGQFGKIAQSYWVTPPTLVSLIQTLMVFAFDFDNARVPLLFAPVFLFGALVIPLLIVFEMVRARRSARRGEMVFAIALAGLPIVLLIAISYIRPVYITRALLPTFLWYAILFAWTLTRMPPRIAWMVACGIGAITFAAMPAYYSYTGFPRAPFSELADSLRVRLEPNDVVVHDNKLSFFPMRYYAPALPQSFIADPVGAGSDTLALPTQQALGLYATTLDAATAHHARVYFIIFQNAIDQAAEEGQPHPNLTWLEQHYRRVSVDMVGDLRVYCYETR